MLRLLSPEDPGSSQQQDETPSDKTPDQQQEKALEEQFKKRFQDFSVKNVGVASLSANTVNLQQHFHTDFPRENTGRFEAVPAKAHIHCPPPAFQDIQKRLYANRFLLLSGTPGQGKRTTALTLLFSHCEQVFEWIGDDSGSVCLLKLEEQLKKQPGGYLLNQVPRKQLATEAFARQWEALYASLAASESHVIFTCLPDGPPLPPLWQEQTWEPLSQQTLNRSSILAAHLRSETSGLTEAHFEQLATNADVEDALRPLQTMRDFADLSQRISTREPEADPTAWSAWVAQECRTYSRMTTQEKLQQCFIDYQQEPELYCFHIALSVLYNLPYSLVFEEAQRLLALLESKSQPDTTENIRFFKKGPVKSRQLKHVQAQTHIAYIENAFPWGAIPQEIVRFKPDAPRPDHILQVAWHTYPALKPVLTTWLKSLMAHPAPRVQQKAAKALGVLLPEDFPHVWQECIIPALQGTLSPDAQALSPASLWPLFSLELFQPALQNATLQKTLANFFKSLSHETNDLDPFALTLSVIWGHFTANPLPHPEAGQALISSKMALDELWRILNRLEDWDRLAWIANYSLPAEPEQYGILFSRLLSLSQKYPHQKGKAFWIFCHILWHPWNILAEAPRFPDLWRHLDEQMQGHLVSLLADGLSLAISRPTFLSGLEFSLNESNTHRLQALWEIIQWLHHLPDSRLWIEGWLEGLAAAHTDSTLQKNAGSMLSQLRGK